MPIKIYTHMMSQPVRAVKLFLLANNVTFEEQNINILEGEQFSKEFLKVNPLHRVPVIDHDGFVVRESVAILRYLCRELDIPDHWYPKDSKKQVRVDEYLEWQHIDTRMNCWGYFLCKYMTPKRSGVPYDPKDLANCEKKMKNTLDDIENVWLKDTPYLVGDTITIADLLGVCEIEQPRMAGYEAGKEYPRIGAWMAKVRKDLMPHYDSVHAVVNQIVAESNH